MRRTLLAAVCLLLCEFTLWGQTGVRPAVLHGEDRHLLTAANVGHGMSAEFFGGGAQQQDSAQQQEQDDPNRPVLKRRPKTGPDSIPDQSQQENQNTGQPQDSGQGNQNPDQNTNPTVGENAGQQQNPNQNAGQQPAASSGPVLQQRGPAPTHFPSSVTVPLNTQFRVTLDETLSSKNSHPGDSFTATLEEPLQSSHGDMLIPSGTKILGTVQDAESGKVFASMRGKGKLILRFDQVQMPDGRRLPIQTTLVSVGPNKSKASANQEGEITSGTRAGDAVKKVGVGAGVGTVAGMIFGSTLKGAAIGAIAGGGYAMAQAGKDVELPARTMVNLRLDQYLVVSH